MSKKCQLCGLKRLLVFILDENEGRNTIIHLAAVISSKPVFIKKCDTDVINSNCIEFCDSKNELFVGTSTHITILIISATKVIKNKKSSLEYSIATGKVLFSFEDITVKDIMPMDVDGTKWLCYSHERLALLNTCDNNRDSENVQYFTFPEPVKIASYDKKGNADTFILVLHTSIDCN